MFRQWPLSTCPSYFLAEASRGVRVIRSLLLAKPCLLLINKTCAKRIARSSGIVMRRSKVFQKQLLGSVLEAFGLKSFLASSFLYFFFALSIRFFVCQCLFKYMCTNEIYFLVGINFFSIFYIILFIFNSSMTYLQYIKHYNHFFLCNILGKFSEKNCKYTSNAHLEGGAFKFKIWRYDPHSFNKRNR